MREIKLLIVEDRDVVRDNLKLLINNFDGVKVEDEASDGLEAIDFLMEKDYDVVLMDINMPIMNGTEATRNILRFKPKTKILINSFYEDPSYINEVINEGVAGFIIKGDAGGKDYMEAIEKVSKGEIYLSGNLARELSDYKTGLSRLCS